MNKKPTLPPEAERKAVGLRMKLTREALGMTPRQIQDAIGVSRTQWNNYERGVSRPNIEDAIRFAVRFNVSLQWIYLADISSLPMALAGKIEKMMPSLGGN